MRLAMVFVMTLYACQVGSQTVHEAVPTGVWGGNGVQLKVTEKGGIVDYGCDSGIIDERLETDSNGKFSARGKHTFGRGGPRGPGQAAPKPRDAEYEGVRKGDELQLTVRLPDLNKTMGPFTVKLGQSPTLERCG